MQFGCSQSNGLENHQVTMNGMEISPCQDRTSTNSRRLTLPRINPDTYTHFFELEAEVDDHGMQVGCSIFASLVQFF